MERLFEQYRNKASLQQLQITTQLLLNELQAEEENHENEHSNVSVFFPSSVGYFAEPNDVVVAEEVEVKKKVKKEEQKQPVTVQQPQPVPEKEQDDYLNPMEIPTLALKQQEINETIASNGESLNDKLKTSANRREVGHSLKDAPIKDLRKAIGINDRYVFINELFRGDETMYERSIKTINSFNIYGEAEFWIKRELKLKLAWNEDSEAVQLFDQLVKRRFS